MAFSLQNIGTVHATGMHANEGLASDRNRLGSLDEFQDLGGAKFRNFNGLHGSTDQSK